MTTTLIAGYVALAALIGGLIGYIFGERSGIKLVGQVIFARMTEDEATRFREIMERESDGVTP